jgi:hypothetical protein
MRCYLTYGIEKVSLNKLRYHYTGFEVFTVLIIWIVWLYLLLEAVIRMDRSNLEQAAIVCLIHGLSD